MDKLEYTAQTRKPSINFDLTVINNILMHSYGQPEMSPEDTKGVILFLKEVVENQQVIIDTLVVELMLLKNSMRNPLRNR